MFASSELVSCVSRLEVFTFGQCVLFALIASVEDFSGLGGLRKVWKLGEGAIAEKAGLLNS